MVPIQTDNHQKPSVIAEAMHITKRTLTGVGLLAIALAGDPGSAYGKTPAGVHLAPLAEPNAIAEPRTVGLVPPADTRVGVKIEPHTSGPLETGSARNLFTSFAVALDRMREIPTCSALFEPFAASGVEQMANSFYIAPSAGEKREFCVGGVAAFTQVGSRVTRLCAAFGEVDRQTAALLLIHEALHSAGMPESPSTAGALSPSEINRLVKRACGL
jgi:hypothetical protein